MNLITKLSIISLTVFIAGCSSTSSNVIAKNNTEISKILGNKISNKGLVILEQAPMPVWASGDAVTYINGRDESVVRVEGDIIFWEINRTTKFTTSNNFIEPELRYESASTTRDKSVTSVNGSVHPDSIWPLEVGNNVNFYYNSSYTDLKTGEASTSKIRNQECRVEGTANIEVLAGNFDAFILKCDSINNGRKTGTQYTYYYAPSVGHYVMKVSQKQAKTSTIELLNITRGMSWLADNEREYLKVILQSTLENNQKGQKTIWQSSDGKTVVELYPTKTIQQDSGVFCRNYIQIIKTDKTTREVGLLCRVGDKQWEVPVL